MTREKEFNAGSSCDTAENKTDVDEVWSASENKTPVVIEDRHYTFYILDF